jgi:uncharacterized protein (TIGR03067 family)
MSDEDAIQGLWRLVSRVSHGQPVIDPASHYLFAKGVHKEIVPDLVDDGKLRATYRLEATKRPKQIVITLDWNGPDGPPDPNAFLLMGLYAIEGDRLTLCMGREDDFPAEFSDAAGDVITLARDTGPIPEGKKRSGKQPIEDEALGRLVWDDNMDWWETKIRIGRRHSVDLSLSGAEDGRPLERALRHAREFVEWLREHEGDVREFAAQRLLDVHNDCWKKGRPTSKSAFMKRMRLESVVVSPDGSTLYYADGGLFLGHSILVNLSKRRAFKDAHIAG